MQITHYESNPSPNREQKTRIEKMGKILVEQAAEQGRETEVKQHFEESFDVEVQGSGDVKSVEEQLRSREDLQFGNNSSLYTTAITDFIEREFQPRLVAEGAIKTLTIGQGRDSIKVPKQPDLQTASTVANDGTLTNDSEDYTDKTIQTDFIGLRSTVTSELLRNANVDLLEDQLRQIAFAISKKVDSDIITEIQKASTKNDGEYGSNNNFLYTGSTNTVSYDDMVTAYYEAIANNANPDMFLCSPTFAQNLAQDADVKDAVAFGTVPSGEDADAVPRIQSFLGKRIVVSSQVGADRGYWIDGDRLGYLVNKEGGMETMDQQLDNKAAFEVKAIRGFGVGITKPQAVYSIIQNTDEPA